MDNLFSMNPVRLFDTAVSSDIALRLSYLEGLDAAEQERQREILQARRYHEGNQGAQLTDRLREFLDDTSTVSYFRFNCCRGVVTAVTERLIVDGFECPDMAVLEWTQEQWQKDNMDSKQERVHEGALRDGEYFVIVDWDKELKRPTTIPYERYTSVDVGGDGQGCLMFYEEDDPDQKPQMGIKWWTEATTKGFTERRNLYYPDRIEKWARSNRAEWSLFETIDWTDATGNPLGIAVVHFKNRNMRPEASDAFPMQRAINKSLLDLIASSDLTAFRIFTSFGFIPTTDGGPLKTDRSNLLEIGPGQVVGTTLPPQQAAFNALDPAELDPQMNLTHQLVLWLATTTNTPVSRFISTKLIASDETLKEQEGPLLARVHSCQTSFGNSWSQVMQLCVKLQNTYGEDVGALNEEAMFDPIWAEAQSRSQQERLDLLLKKQKLGVPTEQLWREAGYSSQRIKQMKGMKDEQVAEQQRQQAAVRDQEQVDGQEQGRGAGSGNNDRGNGVAGRGNGSVGNDGDGDE